MNRTAAEITLWSAFATSGLAEESGPGKMVIEAPLVVGCRNLFDERAASQSHAVCTFLILDRSSHIRSRCSVVDPHPSEVQLESGASAVKLRENGNVRSNGHRMVLDMDTNVMVLSALVELP